MSIDRLIDEIGNVPNPVWTEAIVVYMRDYNVYKAFEVTRTYWDTQPEVTDHIQLSKQC